MKNIVKKFTIFSMVGMMLMDFGASVIEASPQYIAPPMQQQVDQNQDRQEAERIENERHERAMERRPNESERDWNERQNRENQRHEKKLWLIAHAILI